MSNQSQQVKRITFSFRLAAFIFALSGVLDTVGVFKGELSGVSFFAYTTQSNILVTILFGALSLRTLFFKVSNDNRSINKKLFGFYPKISAFVTMCILVTLIIFWAVLVPINRHYPIFSFNNMSVHLISPLLMVADYLIFNKRGTLRKRDMFYSLIIPICYIFEAMIIGMSRLVVYPFFGEDSFYPYPFLDIDKFGFQVIFAVLGLLLFFLLIALIWRYIDNKLAKRIP